MFVFTLWWRNRRKEPEEHGLVAHKPPEDNEHFTFLISEEELILKGVFFILHCRSHFPHMFMLKKRDFSHSANLNSGSPDCLTHS